MCPAAAEVEVPWLLLTVSPYKSGRGSPLGTRLMIVLLCMRHALAAHHGVESYKERYQASLCLNGVGAEKEYNTMMGAALRLAKIITACNQSHE
jgi:hypothetical protein